MYIFPVRALITRPSMDSAGRSSCQTGGMWNMIVTFGLVAARPMTRFSM